MLVVNANDDFDTIPKKFSLCKAIRIYAWISRLNHNSRHPSEKIIGPLVTEEIQQQFAREQERLSLQLNTYGILER